MKLRVSRMRSRTAGFAMAAGVALSCAACAGGQTGEGPPHNGDNDVCDSEVHELELDEVSPLGFAPSRLVELASGPFTESLVWSEPDPEFPYGPESGTGSVTLELLEGGTRGRYVDLEPIGDGYAEACRDYIQVGVVLGVRSEGGALDERVPVTLFASESSVASYDHEFDLDALGGSFAFEAGATDGWDTALTLRGEFRDDGASGTLDAHLWRVTGNRGEGVQWTLARFPETLERD